MSDEISTDLNAEFQAAFIYPYSTHYWQSLRAREHWSWQEGWQDSIAGPIWNIVEEGGCAYVYDRDDAYFAEVSDPETLYAYLRQKHQGLRAGISKFVPRSRNEDIDLASMHRFATAMWSVTEKAFEIERRRWSNENVQGR